MIKQVKKNISKALGGLFAKAERISPIEVYVMIAVVAAVWFGVRSQETAAATRLIKVEVTNSQWQYGKLQEGAKTPAWLSDQIEVGQQEKSAYGGVIAEVVKMEDYPVSDVADQLYLVMKVKTDYNSTSQAYTYKGQPIVAGAPITFTLNTAMVTTQVIDADYPTAGYPQREVVVTGLARSVQPWVIEKLPVGTTIRERANGKVIATLQRIETMPARSAYLSEQSSSQLFFREEAERRDVKATIRVVAEQRAGSWYVFGNQRLRVSSLLNLQFAEAPLNFFEIQQIDYETESRN